MCKIEWSEQKDIGLNGYVSCQVQRAFLPAGLPMYVLGKTLWDSGLEFEQIAEEYFTAAFGDDGLLCMKYLETMSEHFDPPYLRGQKAVVDIAQSDKMKCNNTILRINNIF